MKIRLSISIVTYYTDIALIAELLGSLKRALACLAQKYPCESVVYLVDNSVDQQHFLELEELFAEQWQELENTTVITLAAEKNDGYGAGHNRAIEQADSHYHLILNPDVVLAEDALMKAIEYFGERTEAGLLTPLVQTPTGETQYIAKRYPDLVTLLLRFLNSNAFNKFFNQRLSYYEMRELVDAGQVADVALAGGCFMFARTGQLKTIGGFSPGYFMYFEDFDLSIRFGRIARIAFVPDIRITHGGGNTSNKGLKHIFYFFFSAVRFFRTHGWKLY